MRFFAHTALAGLAAVALGAAAAEPHARGTRDEARAMVDAAVEHVKRVGPQQAFKDFSSDKANWNKKDLYVTAYDNSGRCVAHGAMPPLVGKMLIDLKDPSGKPLVRLLLAATRKGGGWVDHEWAHPQTDKRSARSTYARRLATYDGWVSVTVQR